MYGGGGGGGDDGGVLFCPLPLHWLRMNHGIILTPATAAKGTKTNVMDCTRLPPPFKRKKEEETHTIITCATGTAQY